MKAKETGLSEKEAAGIAFIAVAGAGIYFLLKGKVAAGPPEPEPEPEPEPPAGPTVGWDEEIGVKSFSVVVSGMEAAGWDEELGRTGFSVAIVGEVEEPGIYTLEIHIHPLISACFVTKKPDKAKYAYGEVVKLTGYSVGGYYKLMQWTKDGAYLSSSNPVVTAMMGNHVIEAYFEFADGGGGVL